MNKKNSILIGGGVTSFVAVILVFTISFNTNVPNDITPLDLDKEIFVESPSNEIFTSTQELKKITTESQLKEFLAEAYALDNDPRFYETPIRSFGGVDVWNSAADESFMMTSEPMPAPSSELSLRESSGSVSLDRTKYSSDYSATNIQVQNVDEPDFLKNDGKYVYILSDDKLTIIDGYPAQDAKIILKIGLDVEHQYLENMFLNEDRLVIFYNGNYRTETISEYGFAPDYNYKTTTHALVLDVSNRDSPVILKDYEVDGYYHDARMINDYVYFITREGIDYFHPIMPLVRESSDTILRPDVFYFDNYERGYNFNTITAFNIFGDTINSETFLMGDANTIYVSEDSIYITNQKYLPYDYYDTLKRDRFFDVIVPLLPKDIQEQIKSTEQNNELDWYEKWETISGLLQFTYNKMSDGDKQKLFEKIQKDLEAYDSKFIKSSTRTVIHKILIDKENLEYFGKGEVPGYLLNQFSMDESGDRFRIATTSSYNGRFTSFVHNNVYVLDENLKQVGGLENIAPDETIYSARFMGDKLYLVTFEQIDPFFVIDLSKDTPKILGELKIPGFSNYLHPYDENHIIGIGKETTDPDKGRVRTLGLKLALFDVSDFKNPRTVDTITIGSESTDSEILYNHKALLFDKEKNILSIPVRDYERIIFEDDETGMTKKHSQNWLGFYIYGINPDKGFELKGEVEHYSGNGYNYGFDGRNRSFYIDDVVYTVSSQFVKMNDINDISHEVNEIKIHDGAQIIRYLEY